MIKSLLKTEKVRPFSYRTLTRALLILVVILSILAGFYQNSLLAERKKYLRLEDRYVRVRNELGIEETQKLIDQSHQN